MFSSPASLFLYLDKQINYFLLSHFLDCYAVFIKIFPLTTWMYISERVGHRLPDSMATGLLCHHPVKKVTVLWHTRSLLLELISLTLVRWKNLVSGWRRVFQQTQMSLNSSINPLIEERRGEQVDPVQCYFVLLAGDILTPLCM